MNYTTRLDERGQAHVNYKCPCGCDAGLIYVRDAGPMEAGACCCGRILWVGGEAEAEVRSRQKQGVEYVLDMTSLSLPWGETVNAALAVPASTLEEERSLGTTDQQDHATAESVERVVDPVCGMTIDVRTAAATSEHRGKTYYFCATACKTKFDAEPSRYVKTSLLASVRRAFRGG